MGIYDREYYQEDETSGRFTLGSIAKWPWSYRIIAICVFLFFVDHLIPVEGMNRGLGQPYGYLTIWGSFSTSLVVQGFQIWRPFTYMFIDPVPTSLLFTMLGLYFFGPMIESSFGRPRFLAFYVICGLATVLFGSVVSPLILGQSPDVLTGAFGCIMGLVVAVGVLAPNQTVLFMFVLPMTMRMLAIISVVINLAYVVTGSTFAVCNLGGALAGYLIATNPRILSFVDRIPGLPKMGKGRATLPFKSITKAFETKPVSEDELDRLLDKVHASGIESLTSSEKATLKRASKQRRRTF